MKGLLSKLWFPAAVMGVAVTAVVDSASPYTVRENLVGWYAGAKEPAADTVVYSIYGYKKGWTREEMEDIATVDTSLFDIDSLDADNLGADTLALADTLPKLTARDTIKAPDSLRFTDPFRYKYYVALIDSFTHVFVRDSLKAAGDSLDWPRIDSIYVADSAFRAKAAFDAWYASLSDEERKKYDYEQMLPKIKHEQDSIRKAKQALKERKDSIAKNTPRILQSGYVHDSLYYKRIITWTQEPAFHEIKPHVVDTSLNKAYNDYRFMKENINAAWLGVSGSAVMPMGVSSRMNGEGVSFYDPLQYWSHSHSTLPMFNTKVPYTELSYTGTLFAGDAKEEDNIHLLTSTNLTPELNFTLSYDRNGSKGILQNESTASKDVWGSFNYLGKKYLAHVGMIHHSVSRQENGGIIDNMWIRDTLIEPREIQVALSKASSSTSKSTIFADQQYKIPFELVLDEIDRRLEKKWTAEYMDTLKARNDTLDADKLAEYLDNRFVKAFGESYFDENKVLPVAFVGHSSELSTYSRTYNDEISSTDQNGRNLYNDQFFLHPTKSADSSRVARFDNKIFVRLQPFGSESIISNLNVGIGDRFQKFYVPESSFIVKSRNEWWNSAYIYAGADGLLPGNLRWDASADYVFAGSEFSDLSLNGHLSTSFYPFRKAKKSPVTLRLGFEEKLREPEYYSQHLLSNHFKWDNDFSKSSVTRAFASVDIPRWGTRAEAEYSLLAGTIYYGQDMNIAQDNGVVSVLSAHLDKDFNLFGDFLHLDNRLLFQLSSNQEVIPLPMAALNLRYYIQTRVKNVMIFQAGANLLYNTNWYTPGYNPALGVFYNQREESYNNGPYVDAFVNIKWKDCLLFVKLENATQGKLTDKFDYFSAHHYINTARTVKVGVFWPFYAKPGKPGSSSGGSSSGGVGRGSSASRAASGL